MEDMDDLEDRLAGAAARLKATRPRQDEPERLDALLRRLEEAGGEVRAARLRLAELRGRLAALRRDDGPGPPPAATP
jgi:hypothetical protein